MITNEKLKRKKADDPIIHTARQRRTILITVCIALMAVIASVTGLNVAQPQLATEFSASQGTILWIINIYTITLAALLLPLGAAGDRWGRKPVLLVGLTIFGIANIIGGLAPSTEVLIGARILSGIGAAMIMPVTLAVITSTFPKKERSKAIGIWTAVAGGGGILGMFLSALLVDVGDWRGLFILPIVLVIIAAVMSLKSIPNSREDKEHKYDGAGAIFSALAVFGWATLLHEVPVHGWSEPLTIASLVIGIIATTAFILRELRHTAPLLDLRQFRKRGLSSGSMTLLTVFGVQAGIFVVLYPFFQAVLGWSGLQATIAFMPMAILMMMASGFAPKVAERFGSRSTMLSGVAVATIGAALMAMLVSVDGGYVAILPGMLAMGVGMGLAMTPSTEAITSSLPIEDQGVASALNDVTREFGTALGVALLGAILTAGYSNAIAPHVANLPGNLAASAQEGIATALFIANGTGEHSEMLMQVAKEAFVSGWQQTMWVGAVIMALLFVYLLARAPRKAGTYSTQIKQTET